MDNECARKLDGETHPEALKEIINQTHIISVEHRLSAGLAVQIWPQVWLQEQSIPVDEPKSRCTVSDMGFNLAVWRNG